MRGRPPHQSPQPQGNDDPPNIERAAASLLYPPPYSPDFNPIETALAKLKAFLRKAAEQTVNETWRTIGALLDCFTPTECANYFTNSG